MVFLKQQKFRLLLASWLASLALLLVPAWAVWASTYGNGSYGACVYNQGCSTSTSGTTHTGSTTPATTENTTGSLILLNDFSEYFSSQGKQLTLTAGQIVYFDITVSGQTVRYSVTVDAVGDNYVDLTIQPNLLKVRLYVGDSKQFDVNGDGIKDIEITLNSVTAGQANMTFRVLGVSNSTTKPTTKASLASAKSSSTWWWIGGSLLVLIIGIVWWLLASRRRRDQWRSPQF